jgi:3-oxoacyl-[acyl-carrier-protein] synthase III
VEVKSLSSKPSNVGILGIALHLPPDVRRNDWWPAEVVARWRAQRAAAGIDAHVASRDPAIAALSPEVPDPFVGTRERRVLANDQSLLDLELGAARAAIEHAGIDRGEIDLVLTDTLGQPFLATNSACSLHYHLGLRGDCFSVKTEGAQHAFLLQLSLAEAMIASGRARYALLVQASAASRLLDHTSPIAPILGDGATAAVVGPVADGFGVLASIHRTNGAQANTLVASVPGRAWYDEGRAYLHVTDFAAMQDIQYRAIERSCEVIAAALARAGVRPEDVAVFAMHQGMPWLRPLVQERAGLRAARTADTLPEIGNLFNACVSSTLAKAAEQGFIHDRDLVVIASGGNGMTYGAAVVRWGRA